MVQFSTQELDIASEPITLLIKNRVMEKMSELFGEAEARTMDLIEEQLPVLPLKLNLTNGKISKGENYKFLPYMILDYPAFFSKTDVFALRSMFYWGNFYSFTFHLKGEYLASYGESALKHLSGVKDVYFCVNSTEWEYLYSDYNYKLLSEVSSAEIENQIKENQFIKLSVKYPVEELHDFIPRLETFLRSFISVCKQLPADSG